MSKKKKRHPAKIISISLPEDMLAGLNEYCAYHGVKRSRAIQKILRTALASGVSFSDRCHPGQDTDDESEIEKSRLVDKPRRSFERLTTNL